MTNNDRRKCIGDLSFAIGYIGGLAEDLNNRHTAKLLEIVDEMQAVRNALQKEEDDRKA